MLFWFLGNHIEAPPTHHNVIKTGSVLAIISFKIVWIKQVLLAKSHYSLNRSLISLMCLLHDFQVTKHGSIFCNKCFYTSKLVVGLIVHSCIILCQTVE